MEDLERKLGQAKLKIAEAEREYLNPYFDRISELYSSTKERVKDGIEIELKRLIDRIENNDLCDRFDYKVAGSTRKEAGLSQSELSRLIGVSQQQISRIERGFVSEETISRRHQSYISWLANNGYNPHNIISSAENISLLHN